MNNISTKASASSQLHRHLQDLSTSCPKSELSKWRMDADGVEQLFQRYCAQSQEEVTTSWQDMAPIAESGLVHLSDLPPGPDATESLRRLAVLKLNGGLGTTMGCSGPKSAIEVREGYSFLDLCLQQMEVLQRRNDHLAIPLVLMNSFNTAHETRAHLSAYRGSVQTLMFDQSRYPRIYADRLVPVPKSYGDGAAMWYPPGHGNLFQAIVQSGVLDKLERRGIDTIFVSNIDNLAACVDERILHYMQAHHVDMAMEVTPKLASDAKGGTLVAQKGRIKLLECAQVPPHHMDEFMAAPVFNTNNLWISVRAIRRLHEAGDYFSGIDVIANYKQLGEHTVLQLETAIGAAISLFDNARGIVVPRSRFLPVKTCADLLCIQSDLFVLNQGRLVANPYHGRRGLPEIKLGVEFSRVDDYCGRFRLGSIPSLIRATRLVVEGDVTFGEHVQIIGDVRIIANQGRVHIPNGTVLNNQLVTSGRISVASDRQVREGSMNYAAEAVATADRDIGPRWASP